MKTDEDERRFVPSLLSTVSCGQPQSAAERGVELGLGGGDDTLEGVFDLLACERAARRAEDQRGRHALLALGQLLAAVSRDVLEFFEVRRVEPLDERRERLVARLLRQVERQVAPNRGEARQRPELRDVLRAGQQRGE